jgi:hypothetical protein
MSFSMYVSNSHGIMLLPLNILLLIFKKNILLLINHVKSTIG